MTVEYSFKIASVREVLIEGKDWTDCYEQVKKAYPHYEIQGSTLTGHWEEQKRNKK